MIVMVRNVRSGVAKDYIDTLPDLDEFEVLDCLKRNGLNDTANYLRALI